MRLTRTHKALTIWLTCWFALSAPAHADFFNAFKNYQSGKFQEASAQFMELAELGNGASQFNLGAMAVRGEGREKNPGVGVGWMLAAAENGYEQLPAAKLAEFKAKLTPEQLVEADKIVAQYGRQAIERRLLPGRFMMTCRQFQAAHADQYARPNYPLSAVADGRDGIVVTEFTVGTDGLARDPHILVSMPPQTFDSYTVDAVLKSRFVPAQRNGQKIESRAVTKLTYSMEQGGALWKLSSVKKIRAEADKKNPMAEYVVGILGIMDNTLEIPTDKARAMLISSAQAGQPDAQYWVAGQLEEEQLCGNAEKKTTWLEHAAKGGNSSAQIEWVLYRLHSKPSNEEAAALKSMLVAAINHDNLYALKHAGALFSNSSFAELRDKELAASTAKRLEKYDGSLDPHINEVIAMAFAANDKFKDAVKQQEAAIKKAQKLYWNTSLMQARLADYKALKTPAETDLFVVPAALTPPPPVSYELEHCEKTRKGCGRIPDQERTRTGSFIKE